MRIPAAAALLVLAASVAHADECEDLDALANAIVAAQDGVAACGNAFETGGDTTAAITAAFAEVGAMTTQMQASRTALGSKRRTMRRRVILTEIALLRAWAATNRPERAVRFVAKAERALEKAAVLVAKRQDALGCGVTLNGPVGQEIVFPADNWWNEDVSQRDVAANSDAVIDFIGRDKPLHADFGTTFGIPYVVLDRVQPRSEITFGYDDESDHGAPGLPLGYPIPFVARNTPGYVEGGVAGGGRDGDRHLILVDRTSGFLFEIYAARWNGSAWTGGSGAIFDLGSNARRPEGWTSADAAGLAIFPGLVRAEEAIDAGEIRHALRFTVRATQGYVYPASHDATHGAGGDLRPPLGLRVRLKSTVDVSGFSAPVRAILTAMQTYGLILADNGSDWFITGAPDARWDDETVHDEFLQVTGDDFEVLE
jgi:hypothetical protein